MVQYFYIPLDYETLLFNTINDWTSPENNGWTCITGVYKESLNFIEGNSIVYNTNILREKTNIVNSFSNEGINYSLTGFCLEGDLDLYTPSIKIALLSLNGVEVFNTAEEYLQFIN
jgi:hypothetical protein